MDSQSAPTLAKGSTALQGVLRGLTRFSPTPRKSALVVLVLTCLGLTGLISQELATDFTAAEAAVPPSLTTTAKNEDLPSPTRSVLPPLQSFSEVSERPLFARSRRPSPPPSPDALKPITTLVLAGVILLKDERIAIVAHGLPPVLARLTEGQEVDGWTVVAIHPDHIVVAHGSTEQEIKLLDKTTKRRPDGPPAQARSQKS
jgi:hypothetical protein